MGCHSVTLTCLTYRPCRLPRNLSQQAGWAGFAKLKAGKAWVWVAWYTVGTVYVFSLMASTFALALNGFLAPR